MSNLADTAEDNRSPAVRMRMRNAAVRIRQVVGDDAAAGSRPPNDEVTRRKLEQLRNNSGTTLKQNSRKHPVSALSSMKPTQ